MTITKSVNENSTILVLAGRLDTITSRQLSDELSIILQNNSVNLILDFNGIDYISSAGLRVIIDAQKKINSSNGKMEITRLSSTVKSIFDITGFSKILNIT
jgi:anti-sigma B factor antagonist